MQEKVPNQRVIVVHQHSPYRLLCVMRIAVNQVSIHLNPNRSVVGWSLPAAWDAVDI